MYKGCRSFYTSTRSVWRKITERQWQVQQSQFTQTVITSTSTTSTHCHVKCECSQKRKRHKWQKYCRRWDKLRTPKKAARLIKLKKRKKTVQWWVVIICSPITLFSLNSIELNSVCIFSVYTSFRTDDVSSLCTKWWNNLRKCLWFTPHFSAAIDNFLNFYTTTPSETRARHNNIQLTDWLKSHFCCL